MINQHSNSLHLTPQNDWLGNQYTSFVSRVEWIKANFRITIVIDTADTFEFTTTQSSLITIADCIAAVNDRINVTMRFA